MNDAINPWIVKAEEDLTAAKILLDSGDFPSAVVCFHAQQAVEKYIKAYLTSKGIEFRRTHDLIALLDDYCLATDIEFNRFRSQFENLTDYAIDLRYPGGEIPPSYAEARDAVETALELKHFILDRIVF